MLLLGSVMLPSIAVLGLRIGGSESYSAQDVIEGKPRLQWMGPGAAQAQLTLKAHVEWIPPATLYARLESLRSAHEAVALATLAGDILGTFVVEQVDLTPIWCFEDGVVGAATLDVKLTDPGVDVAAARPRPVGVRDEAEDIVTAPKPEDTSRPIDSVTPAEIVRR